MMNKINENRLGYKETKVGWIPNDWTCVNYSEAFSRVSLKVDVEPSKIYREIGIRSHGKGIFHKPKVTGESLGNKRVFNIIVGALVFNIVFAWEQAVALISNQEHGFIASHRFPMYVGKKDKASEPYFHKFFLTPRGKYLLNLASPGGAGRNKTLGQKELNELKLPLPPHPEQKKIVEILSTWDQAIEKLEKLIELKEQRKKGLMQQLLTGKTRLPGFGKPVEKDGEIPDAWESIKIQDCCICLDNKRVPLNSDERAIRKGDIPYCGANGIVDYINDNIFDDDLILIAEDGGFFDQYKERPIAYRISGKCWVNNHAHIIKVKDDQYFQDFVFFSLVHKNILPYLNGGTRAKLNKAELLKLSLIVPKIQEQKSIAELLNYTVEEIERNKELKLEILNQKKGLMQKLLTGEVRVKVDEVVN